MLFVLLFVTLLVAARVAVRRGPSIGSIFCVWIPLGVLCVLLFPAAVFPSWERRWASRIADHSAYVLSVASAGLGGVLVALAVLLGVVDAQVWGTLTHANKRVEWVVAPTFLWFAILALAVWAFVGYGVHAGFAWAALRRTAAGVACTAALVLPLLVPVVGYQIWTLVDARVASGQPAITPTDDAARADNSRNVP